MPNVRAFRSGNWSDTNVATSPWSNGTAVFAPESNDDVWLNNFTVTLDTPATVLTLTNGSVGSQLWKDGATATGAAGGTLVISNAANSLTATGANGIYSPTTATLVSVTAPSGTLTISAPAIRQTGFLTSFPVISNTGAAGVSISSATFSSNGGYVLVNSSTGSYSLTNCTLNAVTGRDQSDLIIVSNGNLTLSNCTLNGGYNNSPCVRNNGGIVTITNSVLLGSSLAATQGPVIINASVLSITNSTITGANFAAITQTTATTLSATNCTFTAGPSANALTVSSSTATVTLSGNFISSVNGFAPCYVIKYILGTAPIVARTRYALNGSGTYVDMFTADNSTALNQAAPTDVRSGVAYGIGNSQTGRLTVPVRGSVALSVNYGPSMPFTATRSGTTATATLAYSYPLVVGDPITVTSASNPEWNTTYTIASIVSGTEVTFTVPATHSASAGAGALMQTTGTAALDPAAVASAVWGAATRTLTSASGPTAADNATAVWGAATRTLTAGAGITAADVWSHSSRTVTGGTVDTLTNAPTVPSAAAIASQVRTELSVELGRVDASISSRATAANIPTSDITAIKAKTDNLPASPAATGDIPTESEIAAEVWAKPTTELTITGSIGERAKNQSTVSTTGAQLAAALS
jgi:hypothetical protein